MVSRLLIGVWFFVVQLAFSFPWSSSLAVVSLDRRRSSSQYSTMRDIPLNHEMTEENSSPPPTVKRLLCIRHGISIANEWMSRTGNQWGDPNFREDGKPDARLSEQGRRDTVEFLQQQFRQQPQLLQALEDVDLVLISPLTRCLETFHYGIEPILMERLRQRGKDKMIPILALPLLRERVYTTSDTGRPVSVLSKEFPTVDFSECDGDGPWWYISTNNDNEVPEWRPHGQNQWYGVPGEPQDVFEARMKELDEWIGNRPEKTILLVAHWGVLQHLTNGTQFLNAEAKILEHSVCFGRRTTTVLHL